MRRQELAEQAQGSYRAQRSTGRLKLPDLDRPRRRRPGAVTAASSGAEAIASA
ncbi:hypothetical protein I541_5679 [Mycobacteroides abscessus]|nr:hypothetical protein I541_5679 [Mycobacteroides abscessus]